MGLKMRNVNIMGVKPEVRTEPTQFITLINNGKTFSSLDGMACSYQSSDQFHFLPRTLTSRGTGFLETLKTQQISLKVILII